MKVSIIVPVYNVEDYVTECLESISNLDVEYEIIIVNDGSKDNSLEKVNEFAHTFKGDIKVINKDNGGLSSARNTGIDNAIGDYLFFLDSDDYIDKSSFELFLKDVINDGVDIGFADYKYLRAGIIDTENEAAYRKIIAKKSNGIVDGLTYGDRYFDSIHNFINVEACFLLIRKSFLDDNRIKFKQGIYHEDTLFTISCLVFAKKVKYYNYPFYIYRMRNDSIMHTPNPQIIEKKYQDKKDIALELFGMKEQNNLSARFIDTLIVEMFLVSVMHFKIKSKDANLIISKCKNLTLKSRVRVALYKILSLRYA